MTRIASHRLLAAAALALACASCLLLPACGTTATRSLGTPPPAEAVDIPAIPWPPPPASAVFVVPNRLLLAFDGSTTLFYVARKLTNALTDARYGKWSFSSVPRGFALVTQIEQIRNDGTPRPEPDRFRTELPSFSKMSFVDFLRALAKAPEGRYRVIVFVVTDVPLSQAGEPPTEDEAQRWLSAGLLQLPESIGAQTYDPQRSSTTALIYEFEKPSKDEPATFVLNSALLGDTHLEKAGIWYRLTREQ